MSQTKLQVLDWATVIDELCVQRQCSQYALSFEADIRVSRAMLSAVALGHKEFGLDVKLRFFRLLDRKLDEVGLLALIPKKYALELVATDSGNKQPCLSGWHRLTRNFSSHCVQHSSQASRLRQLAGESAESA